MRWKPKPHTDVIEQAANAIYQALQRSIDEHNETVAQIKRDLNRGKRD